MTDAVRAFLEDIKAVCEKHRMVITVSDYDALQVWPLVADSLERLMDAQDRTKRLVVLYRSMTGCCGATCDTNHRHENDPDPRARYCYCARPPDHDGPHSWPECGRPQPPC